MSSVIFAIIIGVLVAIAVIVGVFYIRYRVGSSKSLTVKTSFDNAAATPKKKVEADRVSVKAEDTQRSISKSRLNLFSVLVVGAFAILAIKTWTLQFLSGKQYLELAEENMTASSTIDAPRGRILDRNGNVLVANRSSLTIIGNPEVADNRNVVHRLSLLLGMPKNSIRKNLMDDAKGSITERDIANGVSLRIASYIRENPMLFEGVNIEAKTVRDYAYGSLAAHSIGYTGVVSEEQLKETHDGIEYESGDFVGKSGAELAFESVLQGIKGERNYKVDSKGNVVTLLNETPPVPGNDVELTLDLKVQKRAELALEKSLIDARRRGFSKAYAGSIICYDCKTGEVIAAVSAPGFNPADFINGISSEQWDEMSKKSSYYPMNNRTISGLYPAASTFKSFTGLAGLQYGLINEKTKVNCEGKWIGFGSRYPQKCWKLDGHGSVTFEWAIAESCDIYFYEVGKSFAYDITDNPNAMQDNLSTWGFGALTGIELSGESEGRVPTPEWKKQYYWDNPEAGMWVPGDISNLSIGQGDLLITPLQLAVAYGGIATGKVLKPHILKDVLGKNAEAVITEEPTDSQLQPVYEQKNLDIVRNALRLSVTQGLVGGVFDGFKVKVCAKSGTGETGSDQRDDYAWFVAYGPEKDPQYVCACVLEQGGGGTQNAGPAVRAVLASALGLKDSTWVSVEDTGDR